MLNNFGKSEDLGLLRRLDDELLSTLEPAERADIHILRFQEGKLIGHHREALNPLIFEMLFGEPIASLTLK